MNNEITTNIEKGIKLLNEALAQYEAGNNATAYKTYKSAGQFLNEAENRSNTEAGKISMTYGDNRNFGVIYKIFESNTKDMLKNQESQKNLKKIMSLIRENAVLKHEFDIYNAFTNPTNVTDVERYVNEAISLIKQHTTESIKKENEKLIKLMKECKLNENIDVDDDEVKIYESIEYMLLNTKNFNTINEYNNIQKRLCEYVSENNNMITESKNIDEIYNEKINEVVSKHESVLNEDEIKLIRDVNNPLKAKKLFNEYKSNVLALVREQVEKGVDAEDWNGILDRINNKVFESKTALTDIAEFIEIKNEIEG